MNLLILRQLNHLRHLHLRIVFLQKSSYFILLTFADNVTRIIIFEKMYFYNISHYANRFSNKINLNVKFIQYWVYCFTFKVIRILLIRRSGFW